jgi:iron complex outermembrane receptor protein
MKFLIILFLFLNSLAAQQKIISGKVVDSKSGEPLIKANLLVENKPVYGTFSDSEGEFSFSAEIGDNDFLIISFVGYETKRINLSTVDINSIYVFLNPKVIPSQTVLVEGIVGKEGITPAVFEKVRREQIEKEYIVQDVPEFLSNLPSTTFYSENGNGIGYNYLSIRGFDQRRISVSINGIPQNDPEDHNVYWLDFPDLLSSTEIIQVQRGAGPGVIGYPAIGGAVNIITSVFSNKPALNFSASIGSYNTRKYLVSYSSGLINNKYSVYTKLSQILSSGYRNNSWVRFNSYHLSAVRYDKFITTQLNIYGGPIEDGLAYTGLPKFAVRDKNLRIKNYSDWSADPSADTFYYFVERRPEEVENFSQPHFELLNELNINEDITLNSALFLIIGKGFFDYDASWSIYYDDYFRLISDGYDQSYLPQNALIRAQVENVQYGWINRIKIKHTNGELIAGGEIRKHRSNHWGRIQFANNLPPGYDLNRFYYFYNGSKDIFTGYVNESYFPFEKLNLLGELQLAYHKYKLFNEKYVGNSFSINDIFLNTKFGVNYKFNNELNLFLSFARVTREPRLKNYYDAAESSGGALPQFEQNSTGSYNFTNPFVKPETMNDFELGTSYNTGNLSASLNLFYMIFDNEIVKNGQLDRFGQPVTGNANKTIHQGIELSGVARFLDSFELFVNASFSQNKIENGSDFISYNVTDDSSAIAELNLNGNRITGFPDLLANFGLSYQNEGLFFQLTGKYVGELFSDNYGNNLSRYLSEYPGFVSYDDNKNEAYFIMNFMSSYEFRFFDSLSPAKIFFRLNNIFDKLYSSYALGKEFFPSAERNFLIGVQVGL